MSFWDAVQVPLLATCFHAHLRNQSCLGEYFELLHRNYAQARSRFELKVYRMLQGSGSQYSGSRFFRSFTNWSGSNSTISLGSLSRQSKNFSLSEKLISGGEENYAISSKKDYEFQFPQIYFYTAQK
jgi:hypothetical protein